MLFFLANGSTNILLRHHKILEDLKNIYMYGFELFWSTILCITSILGISILFGYWKLAIIFYYTLYPFVLRLGDIMQKVTIVVFY